MEEDFSSLVGTSRDYGGHFSSYVDCYSALGLLGLLGLLEILREVVNDITIERRKRSIDGGTTLGAAEDLLLHLLLRTQLPDEVLRILPGLVMPLLHVIADVNDEVLPPSCLSRSFCDANRALLHPRDHLESPANDGFSEHMDLFGVQKSTRRKVAQFLTDVVAKAFLSSNLQFHNRRSSGTERKDVFQEIQKAAEAGRNGTQCGHIFRGCDHLPSNLQIQPFFGAYGFSNYS